MGTKKLNVVMTVKLPDGVETRFRELFNTTLWLTKEPMPREKLLEAAATAEVVVSSINDRIDEDFFAAAGEQLKMIANFGVGHDHIDVPKAAE
ncbi:MAG: D-glycerate dehydrogenase, partial [Asticcacaulis sp.]